MDVNDTVLNTYLDTYRDLTGAEPADEKSVTISVPLHLAAHHRVEVTVTDIGNRRYVLSDGARTLGEVRAAGYSVSTRMKERLERIANLSDLRIVEDHLLMDSSHADLGQSIQKFAEISKTIGDVYLVHKQRETAEDDLIAETRRLLDSNNILYRVDQKLRGEIELHPFHLLVPSNGHAGTAVRILSGPNTHTVAQVWGFRCEDIKREKTNRGIRLALIYDTRSQTWSDASRKILGSRADIVLASKSLGELATHFENNGDG